MKFTICLALVAVCTLSVKTEQFSTILAQVEEHPYGAALGSLVQMHLQEDKEDSGRLNDIRDFLEGLLHSLDSQDDMADGEWQKTEAYCSKSIPAKQKQLQELEAKLADLEEEKKELEQELETKTGDLREEKANLQEAEVSLEDGEKQLEKEIEEFKQRKADYNAAQIAIEEALRILYKMVHDPSALDFVQIRSDFDSIKRNIEKTHGKLGGEHTAYVQPIVDVLMQLANEASSNNHLTLQRLKEVIKLLESLLERLKQQLATVESAHKTNVENIKKLIIDYINQIDESIKKIEILQIRLAAIQERLSAIDLQAVRDLIATTQTTLQLIQDDCDSEKEAYEKAKKARESERKILEELLGYFQEHVVDKTQKVNDEAYKDNLTH